MRTSSTRPQEYLATDVSGGDLDELERRRSGRPRHWDRWVFGDRTSGAYLPKFAWTKIVRHSLVRGDASPDNPAQADYWANRRAKSKPPLDRRTLHLMRRQHGTCPICGQLLLHADREPQTPHDWEQWHRTTRKAITRQLLIVHGPGLPDETRLVHASCHRRTTGTRQEPAPLYS